MEGIESLIQAVVILQEFYFFMNNTWSTVCQVEGFSKRSPNRSDEDHVSTMKDNQIKCKCAWCDSLFLLLVLDAPRGPFICKGSVCT